MAEHRMEKVKGGEAPSMLDLTGEEQTITITADTVITKQAGGMQPGGDGQNGGAPEKPEVMDRALIL